MATTKKPAAKKTPVKKAAPKKVSKPLTPWEQWKAQPEESENQLCSRIRQGESLTGISRTVGCNIATLSDWIAADPQRSARVREARIASAQAFDEMALEAIRTAGDPFELNRAKEEAHHLRWRASKINPRDYGDKVEVDNKVTLANLSQEQLDQQLGTLLAKAGLTGGSDATSAG